MSDELDQILSAFAKRVEAIPRGKTYGWDEERVAILALLKDREAAARKDQDAYSRADEFLWFKRKLEEYMWKSTSPAYKGFLTNFVDPQAEKYLKYFADRKSIAANYVVGKAPDQTEKIKKRGLNERI